MQLHEKGFEKIHFSFITDHFFKMIRRNDVACNTIQYNYADYMSTKKLSASVHAYAATQWNLSIIRTQSALNKGHFYILRILS